MCHAVSGDSRGAGQREEAQRGQTLPMAGLELDDDMGEAVSAGKLVLLFRGIV